MARSVGASPGRRPLREFDGDIGRPHDKDEAAVVKRHHLVACPYACSLETGERRVQIVDDETDVVEARSGEIGLLWIDGNIGTVEAEELHLSVGGCSRQCQGHMVGLPVRNTM